MPLGEGDFIHVSYTGRIDDNVFDTTDEEIAKEAGIHNPSARYGPIMIRLGSGHVVAGLEDALMGAEVGGEGEVDVPPEKAFGPHDDSLVESIPITNFKEKPFVGMQVKLEDREGVVTNVIGRRAVVDFNSPLAGKTVHYTYRVEGTVDGVENRVKGLIRLYVQRDMDVAFENGTVTIHLPPAITYDRRWLIWRSRVVHETFEYLPDVAEIVLLETFKRPARPAEEAPGAEEAGRSPAGTPQQPLEE
ncbi:MAG: FKBP-type peptidyl-prolyl cis-trans isomerase [Methanomicrobiales archaeon]|nr:FKBP-type peptidyl-prolyl cis-trans isomerase [Methanomicrobiales archaeon]MDI6877413.1 FKBP-type peptidyl-prolyl cis-trans isomerase [Methanomicrobiales archaeon]